MTLSAVAAGGHLRDWPLGQMLEVEMATNKSLWVLGFGVLAVTGLVCPLRGDARDDRARRRGGPLRLRTGGNAETVRGIDRGPVRNKWAALLSATAA